MTHARSVWLQLLCIAALIASTARPRVFADEAPGAFDVVVYGGTSGGVIAAVAASARGLSVCLVEPGAHLGGLSSGGLGATDIGNKGAIGGLAREFYRRIGRHYAQDLAWRFEARQDYRSSRQVGNEDAMWTFEPHVAEAIFDALVAERSSLLVLREERLDLEGGVAVRNRRIESLRTESGRVVRGQIFIDASYEGDLLAGAGVSYHVGREANAKYGETLNGVAARLATKHQFKYRVDPFRVPGDPQSGLLPGVHGGSPGEEGAGDHRVQAYNFRVTLTDSPENRVPFRRPPEYDARDYELLLRYFDAGFAELPWHSVMMPNRKTDTNNNHGFSTDFIGANQDYPEADHETRARIIAAHRRYQEGLFWCLANEPRVPVSVREEASRWGLSRDEYADNEHWPHQLYVREARRLVGEYVMTQAECEGRLVAPDPVGLAAYTMDSHNVQRYVKDGAAANEGDVQVGGFPPYPIAYGSIAPRREECRNLLVPVCLSASHIAFGSIRMEPVFMVLGESAAIAATLALESESDVQSIDRTLLRKRLLDAGQILEWSAPRRKDAPAPSSSPADR